MENTKICAICELTKPTTDFNKFAKSPDGLQSYCRDCARIKVKKWREDNIEHRKQYDKEYHDSRPEYYYQKGVEYRERSVEKIMQVRKDYLKENPERHMVYDAKKRSKKRNVPLTITYKDITIPEYCPVLGIKLERNVGGGPIDSSPTLDCVLPDKGYIPGNIAVISHRANRIKTDATLEELTKVCNWLGKTLQSSPS